MASADDKTEKASTHKLRKAREEGQVARSRDWVGAVAVCACLQLIVLATPGYLEDFRQLFLEGFAAVSGDGALDNAWSNLFSNTMFLMMKMVLPLLAVPAIALIASLYPGGWSVNPGHLMPRFSRLDPSAYFKRLFGPKHLTGVLASMLKAAALAAVLYWVTSSATAEYVQLQLLPLDEALRGGARLLLHGVVAVCGVFVFFALIDLPVQIFVFLRDQRMSKREVKEEHKTNEGRPEVRQRIRKIQIQMARRTVRKSVPTADVVIVNPDHYAVALKYDEKRAQAPFLVAKGVDEMALYIREVAIEHGIEVVPLPPLARAIYNTSQVNQQIPAALYKAVARVLTYVLQIKAFRTGRRPSQPPLPADVPVPEHMTTANS
jgi:flagellar biosynthesis protein FlhB